MGLIALVFLITLFIWHKQPRSAAHCIVRTHELQQCLLNFYPTIVWKDIQVGGGDVSDILGFIFGRTKYQYFLLQEGDTNAPQEFRGIFQSRKPPKIGEGAFTYSSDTDWRAENRHVNVLEGRAAKLAPWWNQSWPGRCQAVYLGTNSSGSAWDIRMYCISSETNAMLLTRISKGTVD